jgi:hypothetical protein
MRRTITDRQSFRGRGALSNPAGRFDVQQLAAVDDGWYKDEQPERIETTLEPERARELISTNDSPDIPFEQSINPYRGCETGCIYCYARPSHAYMGLSPGLDFETRLFYKADACWKRSSPVRVTCASPSRSGPTPIRTSRSSGAWE